MLAHHRAPKNPHCIVIFFDHARCDSIQSHLMRKPDDSCITRTGGNPNVNLNKKDTLRRFELDTPRAAKYGNGTEIARKVKLTVPTCWLWSSGSAEEMSSSMVPRANCQKFRAINYNNYVHRAFEHSNKLSRFKGQQT